MKKTVYLLAVVSAFAIPAIVCAQTASSRANAAATASALLDDAANGSAAVNPSFPTPLPPIYPQTPDALTSGSLATQTSTTWSTAPWNITVGGDPYPDEGGTATFNTATNITGTVPGGVTITLDVTPTLSGITYNSPYSYGIVASGANTLALTTTGTNTFNTQLSIQNTLSLFNLTNTITAPISGGGTFGLTKTGNFSMTLGGTNTYTGGTHINGGILIISAAAAVGDATLGASGAGNDISFNGGNLLNNITSGWTTARNIFLDTLGGTITPITAATINGVISGSGSLTTRDFTATVTLTNANTYTGATRTLLSIGTLALSGNGSINQNSGYDVAGTVALSNTTTNNNQRLSATAPITLHEGTLTLSGNAGAATTESDGALTLGNGINKVAVTPNAAQAASWTFASMTRQNNSLLVLSGTNLGAAPGVGVAQIISTASPGTLIGGGGAAGSTNISILPWAIGNTTALGTNSSSFVTWNAAGGTFRPLAAAEYSTLTSGASTTDNTTMSAATSIDAATTVNSVRVTGAGPLSGVGGLNITSGALLYSPALASTAGVISANINFGTAEGVVTSTAGTANSFAPGLTLSGIISGSGGLTLNPVLAASGTSNGSGGSITVSGPNTYTGTTTLHGFTNFSGLVANDGVTAGAFGLDTSAIVLDSANGITGLAASAAATVNRNLMMIGGTASGGCQLLTAGAFTFTINGNIDLETGLTIQGATGTFTLNGNISGPGSLSDLSTPIIQLNGNNTYSGGTNIQTGTYAAGSDTAFGTGTIYFSNNGGKIQSVDATAHNIGNNLLLGANTTFQGTGALNFTGGVNLNGSRTFTVTTTNGVTFSGAVSNGAITKAGAGTLALTNANNTYTGGTVITAGTVNANAVGTLGTGVLTPSAATSIANINANQNVAGLSGATSGAAVNIATGVNLTLNEPGNLSYSGNITGAGSLTKTGAGTQALITGTNSFSGGLFINSGGISFNNANSLGTGGVNLGTAGGGNASLTVSNGTTNMAQNITVASGAIATLSAPTAPAVGTLTIGSTSAAATGSTYSGTITLNGNVSLASLNTDATNGLKFTGNITGAGGITTSQTGVVVLNPTTGVNDYAGGTTINAGQLTALKDSSLGTGNVSLMASGVTLLLQGGVTNNYISDTASLSLVTGSTVNLNFTVTPDTVSMLIYNGVAQAPGLWGSATSGAPNVLAEFLGTGEVLVLIPEPSTWAMTIVGASLLLGAQRFRRSRRR